LCFDGFDLAGYEPADSVLHIGISPVDWPKNWVEACANINFFAGDDHVGAWEEAFPRYAGVTLEMRALDELPRYRSRLDYDRGPDDGKTVALLPWLQAHAAVPPGWLE
jgi:hypothetical protein